MKEQEKLLIDKMNLQKHKIEQIQKEKQSLLKQEEQDIQNNEGRNCSYLVSEKIRQLLRLYAS